VTIKIIHTVVWAFFVACILAIWVFASRGEYCYAALSIGVVLVEVLVLLLNGWQCPLTSVAAGYTVRRNETAVDGEVIGELSIESTSRYFRQEGLRISVPPPPVPRQ